MGGSGRGWAGPEDVTCPDDLLDLDAGNVNLLGEVPQGHPGVLVGQGGRCTASHLPPEHGVTRRPPRPRGRQPPPLLRLQGTATQGCHHRYRGDTGTWGQCHRHQRGVGTPRWSPRGCGDTVPSTVSVGTQGGQPPPPMGTTSPLSHWGRGHRVTLGGTGVTPGDTHRGPRRGGHADPHPPCAGGCGA